jgi:GT2 family glycosyltransferase
MSAHSKDQKLKQSIVILNWNDSVDTRECLDSLAKNNLSGFKIILVDNASKKEDQSILKTYIKNNPNLQFIIHDENLGFAKAHNIEFKKSIDAGDDYVFLFNNDTVLHKDCITHLKNRIENNNWGMIGCKMINFKEQKYLDNVGHKMMSSGEIIPIGHGDSVHKYTEVNENIGVCAGAAIYSTEMLKDIGLFDDYFETGYEDAELGLRAFIAGYKCVYEPQALVYHKMGQSIKKIFNYNYTLKIQTNIFYTYLKLVHWQVMIINFIPWMIRFIIITMIDIIFWRPRYLKVQYHALYNI